MTGPVTSPVFQIHPSLRCNLSCAHCYSWSGPSVSTSLEPRIVCDAIEDAAGLGYGTISVSGGEPLLYPALAEILAFAKSLQLRTTVTTNGSLLDARRLDPIAPFLDLLAISLDGDAVEHERLRRDPRSYRRIVRGIDAVRSRNIAFGFIHTLTQSSWEHIEAIVAFAAETGAALVQVHPLELVGRATEDLAESLCDETTLAQVYVLVQLLNLRHGGKPVVQYDILHAPSAMRAPEALYADPATHHAPSVKAENLAILVLEADGTVVPMTFGFGRAYAVANLKRERLSDAWPRFARDGYPRFRRLCRRVHAAMTHPEAPSFVNWYELLHNASLKKKRGTSSPAPV
ncbi:MAG: radical SAM protein [Candidatus Eremiobacteraeota bacterium]|nr:radical SAM protein [Candidatus Eremiobacteraeota bacterium]